MDAVGIFLQSTANTPPLSDIVVRQLCERARQGSVSARDKLVSAHLGLAVHLAKYFYHPGAFCDLGDLIQQGCLGLLRAIEKFDTRKVSRGKRVRFATYAHFWVSHFIRREIENHGRTIAVPIDKIRDYQRRQAFPRATAKGHSRYAAVHFAMQPMISLGGVLKNGEEMVMEYSEPADPTDTPETWLRFQEAHLQVERSLAILPEKSREILRDRYGLGAGTVPLTQKQVGKKRGMSNSIVGYWERTAIKTLALNILKD